MSRRLQVRHKATLYTFYCICHTNQLRSNRIYVILPVVIPLIVVNSVLRLDSFKPSLRSWARILFQSALLRWLGGGFGLGVRQHTWLPDGQQVRTFVLYDNQLDLSNVSSQKMLLSAQLLRISEPI